MAEIVTFKCIKESVQKRHTNKTIKQGVKFLTRKERNKRQINGWWCLAERLELDHVGY